MIYAFEPIRTNAFLVIVSPEAQFSGYLKVRMMMMMMMIMVIMMVVVMMMMMMMMMTMMTTTI
jgi:hypothetical protein